MYDYMCSGHYSVIEARTSTNTILLKLAENFLIKDDTSWHLTEMISNHLNFTFYNILTTKTLIEYIYTSN